MQEVPPNVYWLEHGTDRFSQHYDLGAGELFFKVSTQDAHGNLLVVELTHHRKGGPARHFHYEQEEWFYVAEGEYILEIGEERFELRQGDSAFSPRKVPHVWAHIGNQIGRLILALTPAGQMEPFLMELSKVNSFAPQEPAFWKKYGMELVGPPLAIP
jgi:quercetin dioxygenase-like cupin family protein